MQAETVPTPLHAGPPDERSTDAVEIAGRLRFSVFRLSRLLRQQDQSGLSATLGAALATINREGPITLGALAEKEQVAPPSITKVVAKLEERGYVKRETDPNDRRVSRVTATAAGRRRVEAVRTRRTAWLATRLAQVPPDDLACLAQAVEILERLAQPPERDTVRDSARDAPRGHP